MKIQHKNSKEIIDVTEPKYGKHWRNIYGYLTFNLTSVYFFYYDEKEKQIKTENVTSEYGFI